MRDLRKSQAAIQTVKPAADNTGIQQCKILHCIKPALWQAIHLLPLLLVNCFRESGCCPKQNIHILASFVAEQVLMQFEQQSIYQEWWGQECFFSCFYSLQWVSSAVTWRSVPGPSFTHPQEQPNFILWPPSRMHLACSGVWLSPR